MAKAFASRQSWGGAADILGFLRTFEGAAATFSQEGGTWSLWLPELSADGHPLTPASQVFFPVILRHGEQAFAIRFFYDCSTGKVRYYTSAIPDEIVRLPELENAISELFRHSLPIEAIRQRSLGRKSRRLVNEPPREPRPIHRQTLADPDDRSLPARIAAKPPEALSPEAAVVSAAELLPSPPAAPPIEARAVPPEPSVPAVEPDPVGSRPVQPLVPAPIPKKAPAPPRLLVELPAAEPPPAPRPREVTRTVRVELGPRARSVLMVVVFMVGAAVLAAIGAFVYLEATQDPGVEHHRLQIEEMRLRNGG